MAINIRNAILVMLLMAGLLLSPGDLSSCGPFLPDTEFAFPHDPEDQAAFARGQLGILNPRYDRIWLFIAYRWLKGTGLNSQEQEALLAPPTQQAWQYTVPPAVTSWIEARSRVPGARLVQIFVYRNLGPPTHSSYLNCPEDAFRNAQQTLQERIARLGANHEAVRAWLAAQDQVFANCSAGPSIPEMTSDPLLASDRAYQVAAAHFYAGLYEDAEREFSAIAADAGSPWRSVALYLVARALIRKASVAEDTAALPRAEQQLRKILDDPALKSWHLPAQRMLNLLRARLYPRERQRELALALLRPDSEASIRQDLTDYLRLLDAGGDEDLSAWIAQVRTGSVDTALATWRNQKSLPWLMAALSRMDAGQDGVSELLAAAGRVAADSPAYQTVTFHAIRLMPDGAARRRLDQVLATRTLPVSARNLFLAERMRLARTERELLRDSPRRPLAVSYRRPDGKDDLKEGAYFDDDAARILDREVPLATLQHAASSSVLPQNLQRQVALAAWVRSVLLDRETTTRDLSAAVSNVLPTLKPALDQYLTAPPEARNFAAVFLLLHFPGIGSHVQSGIGRMTPIAALDDFRSKNWWCTDPTTGISFPDFKNPLELLYRGTASAPRFLSVDQQAAARAEQQQLAAMPDAPNFLGARIIDWAEKHRNDPRVPEALHLTVQATHYGCTNSSTGAVSERAFRLLHWRYPQSEWARKTPYWYK